MKILHVNESGTMAGGAEAYIADVSEGLHAAGHSSHLVCFSSQAGGEPLVASTAVVPRLAGGSLRSSVYEALEEQIVAQRPDVAFVHAVYDPKVVEWIAKALPTVAYVHGPYVACPGQAYYLRRSRHACTRSAGSNCLVNAQLERCCWGHNPIKHLRALSRVQALLRVYRQLPILAGSRAMRSLLVQNGVPAAQIEILAPILLHDDMLSFPSPPNPRQMLFVGRLEPEKGLDLLLAALREIAGPWRLVVAGDGHMRPHLEISSAFATGDRQVEFLGWVGRQEVTNLYHESGLVIVPSLWPEPFGRVGPEAAVAGRPVVASAVGGIPDWLEDRVTGSLVPAGDVAALRQAIQHLLDSPAEQERLGRTAREEALVRWRAESHIESVLDCFARAMRRQ